MRLASGRYGLATIGDWRCDDADCDTCRLFDLPTDEAAFDAWLHAVREDIANDRNVLGQPGLLATLESTWRTHDH